MPDETPDLADAIDCGFGFGAIASFPVVWENARDIVVNPPSCAG
jgi:hypothetical protein